MAGKRKVKKTEEDFFSESLTEAFLSMGSLDNILELNGRGIFLKECDVDTDVMLSALDADYSTNRLPNGTFYFYKPTERIIEDPESPLIGHFWSQLPYEEEQTGYPRGGC